LFPALAVIPVLVVALALPHLSGRLLRVLSVTAGLTSLTIGAIGTLTEGLVVESHVLKGVLLEASLAAAVLIALVQLGAFSNRIQKTLMNTRLSEEALREANQRKDHFLAILGHELRNPLAPMVTAVELLRDQYAQTPDWKIEIIDRQVHKLARLVDDLLDISRVTHGKVILQRETIDARAVIEQAVSGVRGAADRGKLELVAHIPDTPLWVHGDPVRLEQVIVNLLSNAVKYTPKGGHVRLEAASQGDDVSLEVRDDGMGIEAQILPHIFEPFFQSHRGLDGGGLGIGLSIVKELVQMHGGSVRAESRGLGMGTQVTVRLPKAAAPAAPRLAQVKHASSNEVRVLIVDDNADAAAMMAELLVADGHSVRVEPDGPSALIAAQEFRPKVAFLDIGLPGMDGYGVVRRLRERPELAGMVLVAVTGYGQASDRQRALETAFDAHLTKPVASDVLRSVLRSVTAGGPG
jgi:signal transduction histidine kinase/CheY-like chemotaxis protein